MERWKKDISIVWVLVYLYMHITTISIDVINATYFELACFFLLRSGQNQLDNFGDIV